MFSDKKHSTEDKMNVRKAEQERVQKKTFTNWLNTYLSTSETPMKIDDLFVDIRDGVALIRVLEILSNQQLHTEVRPRMQRVHCLVNIKTALECLEAKKVKLVNINPSDIADGKPAIVLGLIWSIILYFQIEEQEELLMRILGLPPGQARSQGSAKQMLKRWVQDVCTGKYDITINDFGPSWRDGKAFNAMVHNIDSTLVEMDKLEQRTARENLEHAFTQAEAHLGIPRLLDAEDVDVDRPDEKSIMTYVAQFFKSYPEGGKRNLAPVTQSPQLPQDVSQLLSRIRQTEEAVNKFRQDHSLSLEKQFAAYQDILKSMKIYEECLEEFRGQDKSVSSELQIVIEAKQELDDAVDTWRWLLDSMIPGELGNIANWVAEVEKWMKTTSKSWYQRHTGQKLVGMWGKRKESWRPGSVDPPNSPPSLDRIEGLIKERAELFGLKNHRASQMRDNISKLLNSPTLPTEEISSIPNGLSTQISQRLSEAITREPGYTAVLDAARARRSFLDILYATHIIESPSKTSIRSRRKTSTAGFERRLTCWDSVLEGSKEEEDRNMLKETLLDYENCMKNENFPEKVDHWKEELGKQHGLLVRLAKVDEKLPPAQALIIVSDWIRDCEAKWNPEKAKRIEGLGAALKRRLDAWETVDTYTEKLEKWLSQAEQLITDQKQPPDDRKKLENWLAELEDAMERLGPNADTHMIVTLKNRIEHVNREAHKLEQIEQQKREAAEQIERAKAEEEFLGLMCAVEGWISQTEAALSPTKEPRHQEQCTRQNLDNLKSKLVKIMDGQELAQDQLQQAIHLANDSPLTPMNEQNQIRLHSAESFLTNVCPTMKSRLHDLGDLFEAAGRIEEALNQLENNAERARTWLDNIPLKNDSNHTVMLNEFAELRGNITSCQNQIAELDRLLRTDRMMALTSAYGLQVWGHRERLNPIQEQLKEIEASVKREDALLHDWRETVEEVKHALDDVEDELEALQHALNKASRRDFPRLLRELQKLQQKHENRTASFLHSGVLQVEKLLHPTSTQKCHLSETARSELEIQLEEIKEKIYYQDEMLHQTESNLQVLMDQIKNADEEVKRAAEWLSAQERRLESLRSGPSSPPASQKATPESSKDGMNRQLKVHSQWAEECQNYVNTLQLESRPYSSVLQLDKVDGDSKNDIYPETSELSTRFQTLLTAALTHAENATKLLDVLRTVRARLEAARTWLHSTRNANAEFVANIGQFKEGDSEELNGQKAYLTELLDTMGTGTEHINHIKQSILQLVNSVVPSNTSAAIMVARRELSDFQTELGKLQRLVESQLKELDVKISCNHKLLVDLNSEDDWLSELERLLPDRPPPIMSDSGDLSLNYLNTEGKKSLSQLQQQLNKMESHSKQTSEMLQQRVEQLKNVEASEKLKDYTRRLTVLQETTKERHTEWERFTQTIKELEKNLECFSAQLKKLDSERVDAMRMKSVKSGEVEQSPMELMQNAKAQLEVLLRKRSEMDELYALVVSKCNQIHCVPSDVTHMEQELESLFEKIQSESLELQTQLDVVEQIVFKLNRLDQLLTEFEPASFADWKTEFEWKHLKDVLSFYTNKLQSMRDRNTVWDPTTPLSTATTTRSYSELRELQNEVRTAIDHLGEVPETIQSILCGMWTNWQSKVDRMKSIMFNHTAVIEKLVRALEVAHTCETEAMVFFQPLEQEFSELKRLKSGSSLDSSIKSIRSLLNMLKSDGTVLRCTLVDAVDRVHLSASNALDTTHKVHTKQIRSLLDKVVSNFDKTSDELKARLMQLLTDHTNLARSEKGFQTEIEMILRELNSIQSEAEQLLTNFGVSTDATDFTDGDNRLKLLTTRLEKEVCEVAKLNDEVNQTLVSSPEMSARFRELEGKLAETTSAVKKCQQVQNERESSIIAFDFALQRYNRAYHHTVQRIDHVIGRGTERIGDIHSPLLRLRLTQQLEDLQGLVAELTLTHTVLKTKRATDALCPSSSALCSAALDLLKCTHALEQVTEQPSWLNLERDLEKQLNRLMISKDQVSSMNQLLIEWDTKLKGFETDLQHLDQEVRTASVLDGVEYFDVDSHQQTVQQSLERIQGIIQNQLPQMKVRLEALQSSANELLQPDSKRMMSLSEDENSLAMRLKRATETYDNLAKLTECLQYRFKKIQLDGEHSQAALNALAEWSNRFDGTLIELEQCLPTIDQQQLATGPRIEALKNQQFRTRLGTLEGELKQGESMLRDLKRSMNQQATEVSKVKYDELHQNIHHVYPTRLGKIAAELSRIKTDVDAYDSQVKHVQKSIGVFGKNVEILEQNVRPNKKVIMEMNEQDERPWIQLMEDIKLFLSSDLYKLELLEGGLGLPANECQASVLKKQVESILSDVTVQHENVSKFNTSIQSLRNLLTEFEHAVNKASVESSKILKNIFSTPLKSTKPSTFCEQLAAGTDGMIKRLQGFEKSSLKRLHQTWQQLIEHATLINCVQYLQDHPACCRLAEITEETQTILEELTNTITEINSTKQGWMEQEAQFTRIKQDVEEIPVSLKYERSKDWEKLVTCGNHHNLLTETELEQESQNNMRSLANLLSNCKLQVKDWKKNFVSLQNVNSTVDKLETNLDGVVRNLLSYITSVDRYEERGTRGSPTIMDPIIKTNEVVESYRSELHMLSDNLSSKVRNNQVLVDNFVRIIQVVREHDAWQLEVCRALNSWQTVSSTTGAQSLLTPYTHIKFLLETGKANVQSLRDLSTQLADSNYDEATNDCIRDQLTRADHMTRCAIGLYDQLCRRNEQTSIERNTASTEFTEFQKWLEQLKRKQDQINSEVICSLESCASLSMLNKMDEEVARYLVPTNLVRNDLEQKTAYLAEHSPHWLELGVLGKTQLGVLQEKMESCSNWLNTISTNLNQLKSKATEANTHLKKVDNWISEMAKLLEKTRDGKSPTRIPTYGRLGEQSISSRGRAVTPTQRTSRNLSYIHSSLSYQPTEGPENIPLLQCKAHLEMMEEVQKELAQTGQQVIEDVAALSEQLHSNLTSVGVKRFQITEEVAPFHEKIDRLLDIAAVERQSIVDTLLLAGEFQQTFKKWQEWNKEIQRRLTEEIQRSAVGITCMQRDLDLGPLNDPVSPDIVLPVREVVQRFRRLLAEIIAWRKELVTLETQSIELRKQTQDSDPLRHYTEVLEQHDAMQQQIQNIVVKIQTLQAEESSFNHSLNEVKHFLKQYDSLRKENLQSQPDLDPVNTVYHDLSVQLEQNQPKLLELSDRSDRVCFAASNSALAMNAILTMATTKQAEEATERNLASLHQSNQLPTNTVGGRAKQEVTAIREQWMSQSQRIAQLIDQANQNRARREQLSQWLTRNQEMLNQYERKLETLDRWPTEGRPQTGIEVSPRGFGSRSTDSLLNTYIDQYSTILKEVKGQATEFSIVPINDVAQLTPMDRNSLIELQERYEKLCRNAQERVDWLSNVRENIDQFRQAALEAERWITNMNFKLLTNAQDFCDPDGNDSSNRRDNCSPNLPTSIETIDQLLKKIELKGTQLVRRTHALAHYLVHCALNMFKHDKCLTSSCDLSEAPYNQTKIDTLQDVLTTGPGPFGLVAIEAVRRTQELERNHATLYANTKTLKNRLTEQQERRKVFEKVLHRVAAFLTEDLPKWWSQTSMGASQIPSAISTSPINRSPSTAYFNEKLKQLAASTNNRPRIAMVENLKDCEDQQDQTVAVLAQLVTFKRNILEASSSIGMVALETGSINETGTTDSVAGLAKSVLKAIDRESRELELRAGQLRELKAQWSRYTRSRDAFRCWLTERQTASQHMLELHSQSSAPEDKEIRAMEAFLQTIRDREPKLKELYQMYHELTQRQTNASDWVLEQIKSEFELLLARTEVRLRNAKKEQKFAKRTAMATANTTKRTRLINQLADSVRKINEEISIQDIEAYGSRSPHLAPLQTYPTREHPINEYSKQESVRRNFITQADELDAHRPQSAFTHSLFQSNFPGMRSSDSTRELPAPCTLSEHYRPSSTNSSFPIQPYERWNGLSLKYPSYSERSRSRLSAGETRFQCDQRRMPPLKVKLPTHLPDGPSRTTNTASPIKHTGTGKQNNPIPRHQSDQQDKSVSDSVPWRP